MVLVCTHMDSGDDCIASCGPSILTMHSSVGPATTTINFCLRIAGSNSLLLFLFLFLCPCIRILDLMYRINIDTCQRGAQEVSAGMHRRPPLTNRANTA